MFEHNRPVKTKVISIGIFLHAREKRGGNAHDKGESYNKKEWIDWHNFNF